jgi:hypothetical protein
MRLPATDADTSDRKMRCVSSESVTTSSPSVSTSSRHTQHENRLKKLPSNAGHHASADLSTETEQHRHPD